MNEKLTALHQIQSTHLMLPFDMGSVYLASCTLDEPSKQSSTPLLLESVLKVTHSCRLVIHSCHLSKATQLKEFQVNGVIKAISFDPSGILVCAGTSNAILIYRLLMPHV